MWVYDWSNYDINNASNLNEGDSENSIWRLSADYHIEPGPFMFAQIKGTKIWNLIEPEYSHLMRPITHGLYGLSHGFDTKHFNLIPKYKIVLEEGDIIFLPSWIWHEVYVKKEGLVLSLGLRMFDFNSNMKSHPYFTVNCLFHVIKSLTTNPAY